MKTVNKILQILTMVFGLASLVLFFFDFANINMGDVKAPFVATELAFGSKVDVAGTTYDMARSADILLCFWLTAITFVMSIFSFKSKGLRYATSGFGIGTAIYMIVIWLSNPFKFVDTRPLPGVADVDYTAIVGILAISLVVFAVLAVAYLLLDDYLEVLASDGEKLTIPKRVVRFLRDYKSEVKKIVWPGKMDVIKNTVIVLIMCLLVGALIWLVDFGLGQLLNLILGA